MAHKVKCLYCGVTFDRDKTPCEQVSAKRYAHIECSKQVQEKVEKEKRHKDALDNYIKKLFNTDNINTRVQKQINSYIKDYGYSYSGILKALIYFFEIKENSIEKANGGIGIVPYVYQDAYNHYYNLWLTNQKNQQKMITNDYIPTIKVIKIPVPQKKVKTRKRFSFLDEEVSDEQ